MFNLIICIGVLLMAIDITYGTSFFIHEITLHKTLTTWTEADQLCREEGAMLASPFNGTILNKMKSLMRADKMYHIGIRTGYSPRTYLSIEGVPLENMTEAFDTMIQELDPLDGDCMAIDQNSIRLVPCWTRLQYFCYKTINDNEKSTHWINCDINNCCDNKEYKYYAASHKCYKVSSKLQLVSWDVGYWTCLAEGGRLAVVENENDKQSILEMYQFGRLRWIFIGLRDYTGNGDWKSVDGRRVEDLFNIWTTSSKPANQSSPCGALQDTGELQDLACDDYRDFICEKDPYNWFTPKEL